MFRFSLKTVIKSAIKLEIEEQSFEMKGAINDFVEGMKNLGFSDSDSIEMLRFLKKTFARRIDKKINELEGEINGKTTH